MTHHLRNIRIRDPFILHLPSRSTYYLFGTTDDQPWTGPGTGFDCYTSSDMETWDGPISAFRPPRHFWGTTQFWAPEVYEYNGSFFMFATFAGEHGHRGTQVLKAEEPTGPYLPWSDGPVTPADWACLDGTLYIDKAGRPWMVFCHEWLQINDGAIYAQRLSPDLKTATGLPFFLFNASEAAWSTPLPDGSPQTPNYVTDGPFLQKTDTGELVMLWSSNGKDGYAMGLARSRNGTIEGPWDHDPEPLWAEDGGHGMFFHPSPDQTILVFHHPNDLPNERTKMIEITGFGTRTSLKENPAKELTDTAAL